VLCYKSSLEKEPEKTRKSLKISLPALKEYELVNCLRRRRDGAHIETMTTTAGSTCSLDTARLSCHHGEANEST